MKVANEFSTLDVGSNFVLPDNKRLPETQSKVIGTNWFKIVKALDRLPPKYHDNYQDWVKVLIALRSASPDLLPLAIEWSKRSPKYTPGCVEARWDTFRDRQNGITVGSLFHWAGMTQKQDDLGLLGIADAMEQDWSIDWWIPNMMAKGSPEIIGGPYKTLKTHVALDAAVSLASGTDFLGRWPCEKTNVMFFSGESAMPVLLNKARLMFNAKGASPENGTFQISNQVPRIDQPLDSLERLLSENETGVLFIDPTLKAMNGSDMGNAFSVYDKLAPITDLCQSLGTTLVLLHHASKSTAKEHSPLALGDLLWAGFAEWTRQTWLLSRRSAYRGNGLHELYLTSHNTANQGGLYYLDCDEGYPDPKTGEPGDYRDACWKVNVRNRHEVEQECDALALASEVEVIRSELGSRSFTKTDLKDTLGINTPKADKLLPLLLDEGVIELDGPTRERGTKYKVAK